jgi:hypothetical protein
MPRRQSASLRWADGDRYADHSTTMGVLVVAVRSIPERIGHPFYAREALERNEGRRPG